MSKTELLSVIHDLHTTAETARSENEQIRELTYNLQLHQEELRMQNEELRETTLQLEESRNEYIRLFDFAPVGYICLSEHGIIRSINLAGSELLGSSDRMIFHGKPMIQYFTKDDRQPFLNHLRSVMIMNQSRSIELLLSARGKETFVQINTTPIRAANGDRMVWCSFTNVTEHKKTEEELRLSRANLEAVFENTRDALWSVDKNFNLITSNSVFRAFQEKMDSISNYEAKFKDYYHRAMKGDRFVTEETFMINTLLDGAQAIRDFEFSFHPIIRNGIVDGVSCAARDITERRRIEKELVHAKDLAEDQARLKSNFLSNMSHELRTPLQAIIANCNVVEEIAAGSQDVHYYTTIIEENSRRLIEIINDILDLARLESRRTSFDGEVLDPVTATQSVVKMLEPIAKQKSISINMGTTSRAMRIFVNRGYLERILTNLLGNAIKFTNNGSILINVVEETVNNERKVSICVIDTGVGISQSFLPYIFDEFRRERTSIDSDGSGLGLTITKKLVESMNGAIDIRSSEGKGTTVMVRFPKVEEMLP